MAVIRDALRRLAAFRRRWSLSLLALALVKSPPPGLRFGPACVCVAAGLTALVAVNILTGACRNGDDDQHHAVPR